MIIFAVGFTVFDFTKPKTMKYKLNTMNRNITRADIIADLKRIAKQISKDSVSGTIYKQIGKYALNTVTRHFGSWNNALKAAELRITVNNGLTKLELFQNLKRVWLKLGRQPMRREVVRPLSDYHWKTYRRVFGCFRNALEEFVEFMNKRRVRKLKTPILGLEQKRFKHKTNRAVKLALRHKVLERDSFRCVHCGDSPALTHGTKLEVDHITPYSKGGETIIDNLQTLCLRCNKGKGARRIKN